MKGASNPLTLALLGLLIVEAGEVWAQPKCPTTLPICDGDVPRLKTLQCDAYETAKDGLIDLEDGRPSGAAFKQARSLYGVEGQFHLDTSFRKSTRGSSRTRPGVLPFFEDRRVYYPDLWAIFAACSESETFCSDKQKLDALVKYLEQQGRAWNQKVKKQDWSGSCVWPRLIGSGGDPSVIAELVCRPATAPTHEIESFCETPPGDLSREECKQRVCNVLKSSVQDAADAGDS